MELAGKARKPHHVHVSAAAGRRPTPLAPPEPQQQGMGKRPSAKSQFCVLWLLPGRLTATLPRMSASSRALGSSCARSSPMEYSSTNLNFSSSCGAAAGQPRQPSVNQLVGLHGSRGAAASGCRPLKRRQQQGARVVAWASTLPSHVVEGSQGQAKRACPAGEPPSAEQGGRPGSWAGTPSTQNLQGPACVLCFSSRMRFSFSAIASSRPATSRCAGERVGGWEGRGRVGGGSMRHPSGRAISVSPCAAGPPQQHLQGGHVTAQNLDHALQLALLGVGGPAGARAGEAGWWEAAQCSAGSTPVADGMLRASDATPATESLLRPLLPPSPAPSHFSLVRTSARPPPARSPSAARRSACAAGRSPP